MRARPRVILRVTNVFTPNRPKWRPGRNVFSSVFPGLEKTHCSQGIHLFHDADEVSCIRKVAVMQMEPHTVLVRILVQVIDAVRIE